MPPIDRPPATMMSQCSLAAGRAPPRRSRTTPARSSGAAPRACRNGPRAGSSRPCGRRGRGLGDEPQLDRRAAEAMDQQDAEAAAGDEHGCDPASASRYCLLCVQSRSLCTPVHAPRRAICACCSPTRGATPLSHLGSSPPLRSRRTWMVTEANLASGNTVAASVPVPLRLGDWTTAFKRHTSLGLLTRCRTRSSSAGPGPSRAW